MIKWIIQNNLGNSDDIQKLMSSLSILKISFETIKVIPFSDDPPEVDTDGLKIFYGSTTLTKNVHESKKWKPGVWFNPSAYEFENILSGFGKENLINGDSEVLTVNELLNRDYSNQELLFVRPAADMKEFTGSVMEFSEIKRWNGLKGTNGPFTLETKVQIAEPKNIEKEYRTVVVNKKVITASQYKVRGRLNVRDEVPNKIISFANEMAQLYQPVEVFILDICEMTNGKLQIVEINTFNCAGWYYCDYYEIVKIVTNFACENYLI